jgi:hypothetical protein
MTVQTKRKRDAAALADGRTASRSSKPKRGKQSRIRIRIPSIFLDRNFLPGWIVVAAVLLMVLPNIIVGTVTLTARTISAVPEAIASIPSIVSGWFTPHSVIAPLFTSEIDHWSGDIQRWSSEHNLDPNLVATVMQIESCGHPTVSSYAGAQGLFQVMPFHFASDEDQLDPNTNAMRGMNFLETCIEYADGDPGLAMACYNGGPSVTMKPFTEWSDQTRRYYLWGTGIYQEAQQNAGRSETLQEWLDAGGSRLCDSAAVALGIQ